MIEGFLARDEGKTLEFKENCRALKSIVRAAVAFANTAGGNIVIGVKDRTKDVEAVREAVINAIVHADYSIGGAGTKVAIFDDRIEITNPGLLPFGLTLETALAGVSRLRNRVIGRVFRELGLIEQWGSGLGRIDSACRSAGLAAPRFEELGANFRVTLFGERVKAPAQPEWQSVLLAHLAKEGPITTQEAAKFWGVSIRSARYRLLALVRDGRIAEVGRGRTDPYRGYVLKEK
jgi:predicted HTH transcriptional regulator